MIIGKQTEDVEHKPSANKKYRSSADENIFKKEGVSASAEKLTPAQQLKRDISFARLLEYDGHKLKKSGSYQKCLCPFHKEKTPSFVVSCDDLTGRCFGCDWYGDIFDYEQKYNGGDFRTALKRLEGRLNAIKRGDGENIALRKRKAKKAVSSWGLNLSKEQIDERERCINRLATDEWIRRRICEKRAGGGQKWNPDTLLKLALEKSLGWAVDALAFIYPSGTKFRKWPDKEFIWECDGLSLWRGPLIKNAEHIFLTESETDAIAMIDAGIENTPGNVVIAAPSATSFDPEWAPLFTGKIVTLCFDNDEAGERGKEKVGALLEPYAAEILTLDIGRVE